VVLPAIMAVSAGIQLGGTVLGMIGQAKAAAAQRAAAEYDAAIMEARAADTERIGSVSAAERVADGWRMLGEQRVAFATQGVSLDSEVVDSVAAAEIATATHDANTIRINASKEAWGMRTNASSIRRGGRAAFQNGMFSMAATGLTGAASSGMMAAQAWSAMPSAAPAQAPVQAV